jgi:hypothetical protein
MEDMPPIQHRDIVTQRHDVVKDEAAPTPAAPTADGKAARTPADAATDEAPGFPEGF